MIKSIKLKKVITKEPEEKVIGLSEEDEMIAAKLREAIEESEMQEPDRETYDADDFDELTPEEELSCHIIAHLADLTAKRFDDLMDGKDLSTAKQIANRLEHSEPETMVSMLQAMFLASDMVHAAEDLDLLADCMRYDKVAYYTFQDDLLDTDIFDWFSIECMLDSYRNRECHNILRFPLEVN